MSERYDMDAVDDLDAIITDRWTQAVDDGRADALKQAAIAVWNAGYRKPSPWIPADHHDGGGYKKAGPEDIPWLLVNIEWLMSEVKRLTPREIRSADELDALPVGSVVRSSAGTIACKCEATRGVVFGDDRSFPWLKLATPATVLHEPGEGQ